MVLFTRADQKIPDYGRLPTPLTWDYAIRLRKEGGFYACKSDKDLALCTCEKGHTCRLTGYVHTVAADGTVTPSYVCPVSSCGFHVWARLADWNPNHVYDVKYI
jgi:hypothetical protein